MELSLDNKVKIINTFELVPKPVMKSLGETFGIVKSSVSECLTSRRMMWANQNMKRMPMGINSVSITHVHTDRLNELVLFGVLELEVLHMVRLSISGVADSKPQWINLVNWRKYKV